LAQSNAPCNNLILANDSLANVRYFYIYVTEENQFLGMQTDRVVEKIRGQLIKVSLDDKANVLPG